MAMTTRLWRMPHGFVTHAAKRIAGHGGEGGWRGTSTRTIRTPSGSWIFISINPHGSTSDSPGDPDAAAAIPGMSGAGVPGLDLEHDRVPGGPAAYPQTSGSPGRERRPSRDRPAGRARR
jgi:hypothetical protein